MNGSSDSEQLTHAIRRRRVIYTSNARDFFALHADLLESGGNHPGMIIWPRSRGYSIGEQARRILRVWNSLSAPQMQNRVEFLARWGE